MKKLLILGFIILAVLNQSFAENNIPEALNKCLNIENMGGDNFIFSPDGKNFAYTLGRSIYKNGQKIDELQDFMEIKGITFKDDNETILVFTNGIFSKVQFEKYGTNYNTNGFIIDYPTNTNWIDKKYGEIINYKTSKDGISWAIGNSYFSIKENRWYNYIIKDDKEIGPFESIVDFGYNKNGIFSYEYKNEGIHCINNKGVEKCDENLIKIFKDKNYEDYKKEKYIIPVYFGKDNVSKFFKVDNTEIGPFNILDSSNIVVSNDKSKFALTSITNNLIICDFNLNTPKDLTYLNDKEKIQNSKDLYKISDLENIQFLTKIPYDFNGDILKFIKDIKEKIKYEEIIKIYQKEKDTLIVTKKDNNESDGYEIKIYKSLEEKKYGFDKKYFNLKYNDKVKILDEYHDIFISPNLENIIITPLENGKRKILFNGNLIYESDFNTLQNYVDLSYSKNSQDFDFIAKKNNKHYLIKYINKKIIETETKKDCTAPKIDYNLNL
ncbi:MAG: hypothetical protein PHE25_03585, partial [Candidatus Gracilibacteria bacterium]|nr:hypothetical protein [Candidatus Gracilibacteria bacterium]